MMIVCNKLIKKWKKDQSEIFGLNQVDLTIENNAFVSIKGPSGCGKSTLLLAIGGMIRPDQGQVIIDDTDLYSKNYDERNTYRGNNIGFIFQSFHLIPYLSILENILSAGLVNSKKDLNRAMELIEKFNLSHRIDHNPSELSTGEKQRVALARAFYNEPKIILADEPTGNLDPKNAEIVLQFLKNYQMEQKATIVLVSHQNDSDKFSDKIIKMENGKII